LGLAGVFFGVLGVDFGLAPCSVEEQKKHTSNQCIRAIIGWKHAKDHSMDYISIDL
jgi:hypothetical protein